MFPVAEATFSLTTRVAEIASFWTLGNHIVQLSSKKKKKDFHVDHWWNSSRCYFDSFCTTEDWLLCLLGKENEEIDGVPNTIGGVRLKCC